MQEAIRDVLSRLEEVSLFAVRTAERLVEWAHAYPLDAFAAGGVICASGMSVRIARSGRYISPNTSSMLWSFVAVGSWLLSIALALDMFGKPVVAIGNTPMVALAALGLVSFSCVTHHYTG